MKGLDTQEEIDEMKQQQTDHARRISATSAIQLRPTRSNFLLPNAVIIKVAALLVRPWPHIQPYREQLARW